MGGIAEDTMFEALLHRMSPEEYRVFTRCVARYPYEVLGGVWYISGELGGCSSVYTKII